MSALVAKQLRQQAAAILHDANQRAEALKKLAGELDDGDTAATTDRVSDLAAPTSPAFAAHGEWIATPKAMERLRVSSNTLYRWARKGKLLGQQGPEGTWRFHSASVNALRERHVASVASVAT